MSNNSNLNGSFLEAQGIVLSSELKIIKKKQGGIIRPIFEAFSNSWEALIEKYGSNELNKGYIQLSIYLRSKLLNEKDAGCDFEKILIKDNGTGITEAGLKRIKQLRDTSKNAANKGTGRVQYIHSFKKTTITTVFKENNTYNERTLRLSKDDDFITRNAILWYSYSTPSDKTDTGSTVEFSQPWEVKDVELFSRMQPSEIKNELLNHYLFRFAHHRDNMPKIFINKYINNELKTQEIISKDDIMIPKKEEQIEIAYTTISSDGKLVKTNEKEVFLLTSFVEDQTLIKENAIYLLGKEELANRISLHNLKPKDSISNNRYLFFLSGKYLDERDDDARGDIQIERKKDFKARAEELSFDDIEAKHILWEDIEGSVNEHISNMYDCINSKKEEQMSVIKDLKDMFLLDDNDVNKISKGINISDSTSKILEKFYDLEAQRNATTDARIHYMVKQLNKLNPKDAEYKFQLEKCAKELAKLLPARNTLLLSKYVCRRKIVLDLLDEMLQKSKIDNSLVDEAMLHNLFIKRNSTDVANSDLWLMNEEFLYFRGVSDQALDKAVIDGHSIMKDSLSEAEKDYKIRFFEEIKEDQGLRRPDILLFPEENKCIIIEFKAPKVDVSKHLDQISRYATLIRNLAKDEFLCDKFYGYLIGENINYDSVMDAQADFEEAPTKDCLYRTNAKINGKFGRTKAYLYTEIIKYSDLLKRARRRNQVFTDLLFAKENSENKANN